MNVIKPEQIIDLEQHLIKVPYEQLRKSFKHSHKYTEKELAGLNEKIAHCLSAAAEGAISPEQATLLIDELMKQVETMQKKLQKIKEEETFHAKRIKMRLDHLNSIADTTSPQAPEFQAWCKTRLNRVIVDYLLREGLPETAKRVATETDVQDLVDVQLFDQSEKVEEALRRHSCKECLKWCAENKSGLKKLKSTLEFNLRLQEHIELAKTGKRIEAVNYAKKYLTAWQDTESKRIMQAMALIVFSKDTECQPYKDMYDPNRWTELIEQFRADNYALCSLTSHPLLSITLQAGLSALKTPQCYEHENKNTNCPVCDADTLGQLAEKLPLSHHVNSTIVCRISGKIMNEDNPPMLLPNGRVYSLEALEAMMATNNGIITCPRTGDTFKRNDLKKLFIS
ncbi:CTLH/CRA C-terminal to lish motif domain-containing protein [Radiomyces spectabilis]|uniref:CTLH/CRA C-terminal to lish motif domain-containing protein n=1 Tax=Radiomyces spectabilis TaxID=64574 RepID=UPI00221E79E1|nr:CTLH/CRA C-terminal to lish motif domain-containing protein [Radiomyces spectabilis]KAI8388350.1 CTLH/CRA C-terminal to lish motif domain-containing protein [Radiomyces spectabilis]